MYKLKSAVYLYTPTLINAQHTYKFCFNLKKLAAESHRILVEAMATVFTWFRRFKDGNLVLSDKKRENRSRKVEDQELQAPLDADNTQPQKKMLAVQLGVTQAAIPILLGAMGKV